MAAANNQNSDHATFLLTNSKPTEDFILFLGNTSEIQYEDNFDEDIGALKVERDVEDSGYFSSENFEYANGDNVDVDVPEASSMWCTDCVSGRFTTDAAASTKASHGSAYDGIGNESIAIVEKFPSSGNPNRKRSKRSISRALDRPSSCPSHKVTGPTPIQTWLQTHHRHESLAYRLEQPAKRRKTTGRQ